MDEMDEVDLVDGVDEMDGKAAPSSAGVPACREMPVREDAGAPGNSLAA